MKPAFRTLASLALAIVCALELGSCGQEAASENATSAAPVSEVDLKINDYEKVANEYRGVARKVNAGDVSITFGYPDLDHRPREAAARLQQESAQMSQPQAQRVAAISARTAPYFQ